MHFTLRRAAQGIGHCPAGDVVMEDVGLQIDLLPGAVDGCQQRREVLGAGTQQREPVPPEHSQSHVRTSSADKAAWSEIRDHG